MANALFRMEVVMPFLSGVGRDESIQTFNVFTDDGAAAGGTLPSVLALLNDYFLNVAPGATNALFTYLHPFIDGARCRIDVTLVNNFVGGPVTYTPLESAPLPISIDPLANPLPLEVAVCSSVQANEPVAGPVVPQLARRRGRTYFGPVNVTALEPMPARPAVALVLQQDLAKASKALRDGVLALSIGNIWRWVVWSRAAGALHGITGGHVNDEFDTQRRRGVDETHREIWT